MKNDPLPLVVGVPGIALSADEMAVLDRLHPAGIILFSRNIKSPDQVRELINDLQDLDPRPFIAIDLEGGAVNRLAGLWGTLPSPARAAAAGRRAVRALGEAAGAACRNLGIHLNLAPVIDLEIPQGLIARQSRALSDDPERTAVLARVFNDGLKSWCVAGCIKHFPGLGAIPVDTHEELPTLELSEGEIETHISVFGALSEVIPIVMIAHVIVPGLGDTERPASLSRVIVEQALNLPGSPIVLSDDIEMGALAGYGDIGDRVIAALKARNHGVLVCKAFDQLDDIRERIEREISSNSVIGTRIPELSVRLATLRRDLCRYGASVPAPNDQTVEQLWETARREAQP
jgi:beta-N-acetylhexosaminidase